MTTYRGSLQIADVAEQPLEIYLDLDQGSLAMRTFEGEQLGEWPLNTVQIVGEDNGFMLRIEGTPARLRTDNDGAFATEVGLRWAPPRLRRLMAAHNRTAA